MNSLHYGWKSSYQLGIDDIDFQHYFFINLLNRLANCIEKSNDHHYKQSLISELNAFARFHFTSEENMMSSSGYPGLEEHREEHRNLIDQLSAKEMLFLKNKSNEAVGDIISFLFQWFLQHSNSEDQLFADYLKQNDLTVQDSDDSAEQASGNHYRFLSMK